MKPTWLKTKIITTIGPASANIETLKQMIMEGVDVCRLNFSHGTYENHKKVIDMIREINKELDNKVAILADLQGPKLRVGEIENGSIELINGTEIDIVNYECIGTTKQIYVSYPQLPKDVKLGESILIDDGRIKLEVIETNKKDTVRTRVIYGGILTNHKGVNFPETQISLPSMTEKDIKDAEFALENDIDWIALSFVRCVTDIVGLKEIIKHKKKQTSVIAKIEKPEALKEIDNIIDMTDAIMIARGDMGVELPFECVPLIQKELIQKCINASKPVIVATQMLESMITNFRPTRAETTDVANAVLDGADTLMLSAETASGKFPIEAVRSMNKIIKHTLEKSFKYFKGTAPVDFSRTFLADSICYNAVKTAQQANARAIVTFTHSGYTASKISSYRPKADIYAFTNNYELITKMALLWGVRVFYFDKIDNIDQAIDYSIKVLTEKGLIKHEDIIVHAASIPMHKRDRTNMLKISYV